MFAAALLASLLAQAEQAPATAPSPAAAPVAPAAGPAEPAPTTGPAEPAPKAAAPGAAPAAPARPSTSAMPPPPPPAAEPPPTPPNTVSVLVRYAYRIENGGTDLVPAAGFSLGGEFERRLLGFQNGFELGLATDFFYDRFARDVVSTAIGPTGEPESVVATRTLSQTSFALMETTGWRYGDMRLFVGIAGGLAVGYFNGATTTPTSSSITDMQLLTRGVFGFDFAVAPRTSALLRVDYTRLFLNDSTYDTPDGRQPLFGDIFNAGIGLLVRF
jgi:hypothetical protein